MRGGNRILWLSGGMILFIPLAPIQWIARILLVLAGLSWIYAWLMKEYLVVERGQGETLLYRHTPGTVELKITNYLALPVTSVLVVDQLGGLLSNGEERRSMSLGPGQTAFLPYAIRSHNRGYFELGPITLQGSDPLGFFPWEKRLDLPGHVLVMPKIQLLEDCFHYGSPTGEVKSTNPLHRDPSRLKNFHQYEPGDDPRTISWKLSARSGVLQVSEFESSSTYPGVVILNFASSDYGQRKVHHALERTLEVAASAVHYWAQSKQEFGCITNGSLSRNPSSDTPVLTIGLGKGQGQGSIILRHLAALQPISQVQPQSTSSHFQILLEQLANLRPPQGTSIIYIGPPPDPQEISNLISFGNRTWNTELWLISRDGATKPKESLETLLVPGTGVKALRWISEYGEEVFGGQS